MQDIPGSNERCKRKVTPDLDAHDYVRPFVHVCCDPITMARCEPLMERPKYAHPYYPNITRAGPVATIPMRRFARHALQVCLDTDL